MLYDTFWRQRHGESAPMGMRCVPVSGVSALVAPSGLDRARRLCHSLLGRDGVRGGDAIAPAQPRRPSRGSLRRRHPRRTAQEHRRQARQRRRGRCHHRGGHRQIPGQKRRRIPAAHHGRHHPAPVRRGPGSRHPRRQPEHDAHHAERPERGLHRLVRLRAGAAQLQLFAAAIGAGRQHQGTQEFAGGFGRGRNRRHGGDQHPQTPRCG